MTELNPTIEPEMKESVTGEIISLVQTHVGSAQGDSVRLNQCSVTDLQAETAEIHESALRHTAAQEMTLVDSMVLIAQAGQANISESLVGGVKAQDVVVNGNTVVAAGQNVHLQQSKAGIVAGNQVTGEKIETVLLLAQTVNGPVETKIGPRGLALMGVAAGITTGLVVSLVNFLRSKR